MSNLDTRAVRPLQSRPKAARVTIFAGGVLSCISDGKILVLCLESIVNYFNKIARTYNFRRMFNKEKKATGYAFFEVDA